MNKWWIVIILALAFGLSLWLRVGVPFDFVFRDGYVVLTEVDPYAHMRLVDSVILNHFNTITIDPYISDTVTIRPLLAWVVSAFTFIFSGFDWGNITQQMADTVGAWLPAICGVLLIVPVYIITRKVFSQWAALLASVIVAIIPGELIARTSLGFTDHHSLEILLSLLVIMFLVLAMRSKFLYAIGAGVCLGLYMLNWAGAPIILVVLCGYVLIQSIVSHLRGQNNSKLFKVMLLAVGIATALYAMFDTTVYQWQLYYLALGITLALPAALWLMWRFTRQYHKAIYPMVTVFGLGLLVVVFVLFMPETADMVLKNVALVAPTSGAGLSIVETQPLNVPILWGNFMIAGILAVVGLVFMVYDAYDDSDPSKVLIAVWCVAMFLLAVLQRRFVYYLAPVVAILAGYICWLGIRRLARKKLSRAESRRRGSSVEYKGMVFALSSIAIIVLLIIPLARASARQESQHPFAPTTAWIETLEAVRANTPEPVNETYYYKLYDKQDEMICTGNDIERIAALKEVYPDAYRVLSWWDYGHWIVRIAQRPVVCSPAGGFTQRAASFFVSQDEGSACKILDELGVKYIVIDYMMPTMKFYAMPLWAGVDIKDSSPEHYNSMVYRLYFGEEFEHIKFVYQSSIKIQEHSQVKVFEYLP